MKTRINGFESHMASRNGRIQAKDKKSHKSHKEVTSKVREYPEVPGCTPHLDTAYLVGEVAHV